MMDNPELKRNIWLQINSQRLLMMPLILGLIFVTSYQVTSRIGFWGIDTLAIVLFFVLTGFWGGKRCMESVSDEVIEHTWDNQKLSTITPWSMTWAKQIGSSIYSWYGGIICLLAWLWFAHADLPLALLVKIPLALILAAFLLQAVSFGLGVLFVRKRAALGSRRSSLVFFFLILVFVNLFPFSSGALDATPTVFWYDVEIAGLDFIIFSLSFWCLWIVVGNYRLMRLELQYRNGPFIWWFFLAGLIIYLTGLDNAAEHFIWLPESVTASTKAWLPVVFVSYFMLINEPKDAVMLRQVSAAWRERRWTLMWQTLPCWMLSVPVILGYAIVIAVQLSNMPQDGFLFQVSPWFAGAISLFFLRDAALFVLLAVTMPRRRADATAIVYLLVLYLVIPVFLGTTGSNSLVALFIPLPSSSFLTSLLPPLVQTIALLMMIRRRLQPERGKSVASNP
jgi:hypothetical protein